MKKITKRVIALLIMFSMTICCVMGNEMNPAYAEETSKNLVVKAENSLKVYICFTPCNASEISGKFPQYVLSIYS